MSHPYRTAPPRERRSRSQEGRLLKASVAFGCACVVGGCVLLRDESLPCALLAAAVGGALIVQQPRVPR